MRLVLPRLFVQPLQNLIGVGVDVEIHLFVVVFQQIVRISAQHLVYHIIGFEVSCFARDDMHDQMFEGAIGTAVLDVDGRGIAGVEGLHGSGEQFEREREVEHLNGLEVGKLCDLAPGGEQHICMVGRVRPSRSCTMGMRA